MFPRPYLPEGDGEDHVKGKDIARLEETGRNVDSAHVDLIEDVITPRPHHQVQKNLTRR
jgi:hypothetical protein